MTHISVNQSFILVHSSDNLLWLARKIRHQIAYSSHIVNYTMSIVDMMIDWWLQFSGNVQGITSFKDRGDLDDTSERSTPNQKKRGVNTTIKQDVFKEIEMKENMAAQNIAHASSSGRKKKRSTLKDSNENLPYTEFEGLWPNILLCIVIYRIFMVWLHPETPVRKTFEEFLRKVKRPQGRAKMLIIRQDPNSTRISLGVFKSLFHELHNHIKTLLEPGYSLINNVYDCVLLITKHNFPPVSHEYSC